MLITVPTWAFIVHVTVLFLMAGSPSLFVIWTEE